MFEAPGSKFDRSVRFYSKLKASIVSPANNRSTYFAQTTYRALDQANRNVEVMVVTGSSNDEGRTTAIALSYIDKTIYKSCIQPDISLARAVATKSVIDLIFR